MKLEDKALITGELFFYMSKSPDIRGDLVMHDSNLVVSTGLNWIAQRIGGATSPAPKDMNYMEIGSSTIAPQMTDIGLIEPLPGRSVNSTPQVTNNRVTFSGTFVSGVATGAVTEAGLFDSPTGGVMLSRSVFPVVNKQVDDYLTVLWVISVGTPV